MTDQTARAESAERNQRAVFAALRRMTKDRTLLVQSWQFFEQHFAAKPVVVVNDFVAALDSELGLEADQKRSLTVALFAALNRNLSDLPELPIALRGRAEVAAAPKVNGTDQQAAVAEDLSAEQVVFRALVGRFTDRVSRHDPAAAAEMSEELEEGGLIQELAGHADPIGEWIEANFATAKCPLDLAVPQMQKFVHHLYVAACEALGPVSTDRLLGAAVADAARLPQAEMFPPDRLL